MVLERIQLRREKGWKLPSGATSVARPHLLGNPFRVGEHSATPAAAAELFELCVRHCHRDPHLRHVWREAGGDPAVLDKLNRRDQGLMQAYRGKHLGCFCDASQPCHADFLLRWFNADG